ncbi:MAG TPA: cytidylate kinase-like family protein [Spirochaetota bacterium]|nr:cytidylate kinase-like family protein [Spirochaetota bacterium]
MPSSMQKYINAQVTYWKQQKEKLATPEKTNRLPFITISREYGCGGYEVAKKLVEIFNDEMKQNPQWAAYNRELLDKVMDDLGLSSSLAETLTGTARSSLTNLLQTSFSSFPTQVSVHKKLAETITLLALNGNVVVVGRGSNIITRSIKNGYHVRLVAPISWRTDQIINKMNIPKQDAGKLILERTRQRDTFLKEYLKFDVSDPHNYHLIINNADHSVDQAARIIIESMKIKGLL